ncbi:MAG TPA: pyridoxamine 5'-phosphate oxidase family protein [Tepidisphaeraceae bacterium]|nr:pyridoxamine 5'-phosphate oxidase family protein [Tepidisphaeraceae bacterium]
MHTESKTSVDHFDTLYEIISRIHTAMFVTRRADGTMHGRPMGAAQVPHGLHELFFATERDSVKVDELAQSNRVLLSYNSGGSTWATVNGHARIVDDRNKIKELWSPLWKNWFSGPDDPTLTLICVTPEEAEYWDGGSRIGVLTKLALAALTGKKMNEGENERVQLNPQADAAKHFA